MLMPRPTNVFQVNVMYRVVNETHGSACGGSGTGRVNSGLFHQHVFRVNWFGINSVTTLGRSQVE